MEAVEIQTGSKPAASIIWLHGLGADGHDFEPIVPELKLAKPLRFVFPHAPVRPVTINQGMRMRAWYDILQFGGGPEDDAGIRASQGLVEELIAKEKKKGLPSKRSSWPGSRRAAPSRCRLRCAIRNASPACLRYPLTCRRRQACKAREAPRIRAFDLHGARQLRRHHSAAPRRGIAQAARGGRLPRRVARVPMPHSVCAEEIADLAAFLARIV